MKSLMVLFYFLTLSSAFATLDNQDTRQKACDSATTKQICYRCCLDKIKDPQVTTDKVKACDFSTTQAAVFLSCLDFSKSPKITPDRILQCNKVGSSATSFYDCLRFFYKPEFLLINFPAT